MQKLANLKGAKALSKKEQKSINGGAAGVLPPSFCHGQQCSYPKVCCSGACVMPGECIEV